MPTIWQPHLGKPGFIATLVHTQQHARATTGLAAQGRVPFIRTFLNYSIHLSIYLLRLLDTPDRPA